MAAGLKTISIRFTGNTKGLDRAAKNADKVVDTFGSKITKKIAGVAAGLPSILGSAVGSLPPQGQAIALVLVAGLTAALLPLLGAALSAAVLGAVGGGVLVAGIKAAASNPRVKSAFGELKKTAQGAFKDLGKPFVEPLVRAARTFRETVDKTIGPSLNRMGKMVAPVIDKLAPALDQFFKNVMPGVEKAVAASLPLFDTLADKLPLIGTAIGIFFETISKNGPQANDFFGEMLELIAGLIIVFGNVIAKLASWYTTVREKLAAAKIRFLEFKVSVFGVMEGILTAAEKALGWIPGMGSKLRAAKKDFTNFKDHANRELRGIRDREVRVSVWSNVASVVADIGRKLASLPSSTGPRTSGRRASGGPVSPGRSYLVGERGPEVLTMGSTGGHVTPNRELDSGGGDLYLTLDLGRGIEERLKIDRRDLKRRAGARGAFA